ncbi:MAG: hypothetical protein QG635_1692 [Bacteroidota bacterium]|nr:hypothetical protein [Bacteroidota bacterium]
MVLVEFAMFPTDKGESVSAYVSQIIDIIDRSGLQYKLTPMGTIIEGSFDQVMSVIGDCFKKLEPQCGRIYSTIKIDYRTGENSRMKSKTEKIEKLLDRNIQRT